MKVVIKILDIETRTIEHVESVIIVPAKKTLKIRPDNAYVNENGLGLVITEEDE